ncbi:hypothetical protein DES43_11452 [Aquamicrobium defluvii]|uniref:Uncharacterized protein n=1 Tax=Aquamicrobium defluvii TaxID=69279 RepID=A0A4R6YEG5_9HYPH|nr:hypothetical protein DES43_11452 [Aquamicrobium defluvii]
MRVRPRRNENARLRFVRGGRGVNGLRSGCGSGGGGLRPRRARLRARLSHRAGNQTFANGKLASGLSGAADGFSLFTAAALGWFLIGAARLHFTENAFALQFLLEDPEGLIDVVVTNEYLQ